MKVSHGKAGFNHALPSGQPGVSRSVSRDPFIQTLKGINTKSPWTIFLLFLALGMIDDLGIGAITGNWHPRPGVVGVFDTNNIPPLIMSLIVMPGIWAFAFGFPRAFFRLFDVIRRKRILNTNQKDVRMQVDALKRIRKSVWFMLLAVPFTIGFVLYALATIRGYSPVPWYFTGWHWWVFFVRLASTYYLAVYSSIWALIALITLSSIFRNNSLKVNPYDGDNAGGLRFVGTFILEISRLTLILVPFLIGEILFALRLGSGFSGQFNLWLELLVLPSLLFVVIFVPLTACRRAMFNAKDEFLNPLRDKILNHVSRTYHPQKTSKPQLEEIMALINLHNKLQKDFPTWPFDLSMSQQFGFSFILALIPSVFNLVQQISSGLSK